MPEIKTYTTLREALEKETAAPNPVEAAEHVLKVVQDKYPDATGIVLFVNVDFSSSQFGAWTCLPVGPSNSLKSVTEAYGRHLGDLPSQRKYPMAATLLPGFKTS